MCIIDKPFDFEEDPPMYSSTPDAGETLSPVCFIRTEFELMVTLRFSLVKFINVTRFRINI